MNDLAVMLNFRQEECGYRHMVEGSWQGAQLYKAIWARTVNMMPNTRHEKHAKKFYLNTEGLDSNSLFSLVVAYHCGLRSEYVFSS
jgi:hypothetical protein